MDQIDGFRDGEGESDEKEEEKGREKESTGNKGYCWVAGQRPKLCPQSHEKDTKLEQGYNYMSGDLNIPSLYLFDGMGCGLSTQKVVCTPSKLTIFTVET